MSRELMNDLWNIHKLFILNSFGVRLNWII